MPSRTLMLTGEYMSRERKWVMNNPPSICKRHVDEAAKVEEAGEQIELEVVHSNQQWLRLQKYSNILIVFYLNWHGTEWPDFLYFAKKISIARLFFNFYFTTEWFYRQRNVQSIKTFFGSHTKKLFMCIMKKKVKIRLFRQLNSFIKQWEQRCRNICAQILRDFLFFPYF